MDARPEFGQTLRTAPSDAQAASHKLLVRGGFVRQVAAGVFAWLPRGLRVLRNVERIVREELDAAGADEIVMPLLQPADLWQRSGRAARFGDVLYRLTDRAGREFCLGPTHEEVAAALAASEIGSYRDLPALIWQAHWKFRDEPRPRGGLLRGREFLMQDAYSFDADADGLAQVYDRVSAAYQRVFARCGLDAVRVRALPGVMGGDGRNEEFQVRSDAGEDTFVSCPSCGYAANAEAAEARIAPYDYGDAPPEKVHTPGMVTVAEVATFLGVEPRRLAKALLYRCGGEVVCALVGGDRELDEARLERVAGAAPVMLTDADFEATGHVKGFAGPAGLRGARLIADVSLRGATGLVCGANEPDHHLTGVSAGRDFEPGVWAPLVAVRDGDGCPRCDGVLRAHRGIEVAHVFELGTAYSKTFGATFADSSGAARPLHMGCYGLGLSRAVAAIAEAHHDDRGIVWPRTVAPEHVCVLVLSSDDAVVDAATSLAAALRSAGVSVAVDRRGVSAGVKFADADLVGYPLQVVAGKRFAESGDLEATVRATGARRSVPPDAAAVTALLGECP